MSKMIQIRNVPDPIHRKLKSRAAAAGMTLTDFLLAELADIAERPSPQELRERLEGRLAVMEGERSDQAVRAVRDER